MIWLALFYFVLISVVSALVFSGQWRNSLWHGIKSIIPQSRQYLKNYYGRRENLSLAPRANTIGNGWDQQQILVVLAGIFLLGSPVLWMATRDTAIPVMSDESADSVDPQIYALLEGEMLVPPPEVDAELIVAAEAIAMQAEQIAQQSSSIDIPVAAVHTTDLRFADRKWDRINPRYAQRLLLVFKIMKERYGYEMVLLEGYRSPQRQNMLAGKGAHVTKATGYRSYHQFGLAGDVAFLRNGKVVITEKDPWAMQGYRYYGEVAESVGLTWGGRWKMMDLGHTEFRMKGILGNAAMAEKLIAESNQPLSALQ